MTELREGQNFQEFTLKGISRVVTRAREEILGIPMDPNSEEGNWRIYSRVIQAQQKARKDSGSEWTQGAFQKKYHNAGELRYDADHATGILDALKERATGKNAVVYEKEGLTPAVIDRAEQILFGVSSEEKSNTF